MEKDSKLASDTSVQQKRYRQEAQKLMDWVIAKNSQEGERAISLVLELAVGKVQEVIQRMVVSSDGNYLDFIADRLHRSRYMSQQYSWSAQEAEA